MGVTHTDHTPTSPHMRRIGMLRPMRIHSMDTDPSTGIPLIRTRIMATIVPILTGDGEKEAL